MANFSPDDWKREYLNTHPELDAADADVSKSIELLCIEAQKTHEASTIPRVDTNVKVGFWVVGFIIAMIIWGYKIVHSDPAPLRIAPGQAVSTSPYAPTVDMDLVNRCAEAAVDAGLISPSCGQLFMDACVNTQSKREMKSAVSIAKVFGGVGNKSAECGTTVNPVYERALRAADAANDKF